MRFIALAFGVTKAGQEIIDNMGKNVLEQEIKTIDLKTTEPDISPTDWVLCFGARAKKEVPEQNHVCLLPMLKDLEPGHDKERETAYKNLLVFLEAFNSIKTIKQEDVANLSCDKIQSIESRLKQKGEISWVGKTRSGKSIELFIYPQESKADISLTFSELYAIRMAMDVLDVEEVEIK